MAPGPSLIRDTLIPPELTKSIKAIPFIPLLGPQIKIIAIWQN
jgi:hypothetical protein